MEEYVKKVPLLCKSLLLTCMKHSIIILLFMLSSLTAQSLDSLRLIKIPNKNEYNAKKYHYKAIQVLADQGEYEIIFTKSKYTTRWYYSQPVNSTLFNEPFKIVLDNTNFRVKNITKVDCKDVIKTFKIYKSEFIYFEGEIGVGYNFYYIYSTKKNLDAGILKLSLSNNFQIEKAEKIVSLNGLAPNRNIEWQKWNEKFIVLKESWLKNDIRTYSFFSFSPPFTSISTFDVSVTTGNTTKHISEEHRWLLNGSCIHIYSNNNRSIYDLVEEKVTLNSSDVIQFMKHITQKDQHICSKTLEPHIITNFILRKEKNSFGYNQIMVLRDSIKADSATGKLSNFTYEISDEVSWPYFSNLDMERYRSGKYTQKGIPGLLFDTIIQHPNGEYFLILKNVMEIYGVVSNWRYESGQIQNVITYSDFYKIYGPPMILHFGTNHQLLKLTVFDKLKYPLSWNNYNHMGYGWLLHNNNLYLSISFEKKDENNKNVITNSANQYYYKYDINKKTGEINSFNNAAGNVTLHPVNDKIFIISEIYFDWISQKYYYTPWVGRFDQ
jgi:hypothetical protein